MFQKARLNLTAWYLLIIMLISMSFSVVIYRGVTTELNRIQRIEQLRLERRFPTPQFLMPPDINRVMLDEETIAETKHRFILILVAINAAILTASTLAGYFLAGKTLEPIANMIDEQNRFISDASHELRTPLTSLKSELEVNLRSKNLSVQDTKRILESNLEEVNHLQILSDNLIKLTQYDKGENGIPLQSLKLLIICKDAIRKVSTIAKNKRITITHNVPDITLEGNGMLLTELIIILLDNAIKYSQKGKKVTLSVQRANGQIVLRVVDQGVGIHKEDIPHVFDRFYRADKSRTKSDVSGYGLGLAIAKQIVERHNGNIQAESAFGKGSTFTVRLPIKH